MRKMPHLPLETLIPIFQMKRHLLLKTSVPKERKMSTKAPKTFNIVRNDVSL